MTTEIATSTHQGPEGSALVIRPDQSFWTDQQGAALSQLGVNASMGDLAVFFHQCQRTGLDPFAKQIYMVARQGKQTIQTGIDGFRLIARRATDARGGTFGYEDTLWCGPDGVWRDVWLEEYHPSAAKVVVVRDGNPFPAIALWDEYKGTKGNGSLNQMWSTKGALMLAKCAEALALRKAFPQDLSGLYTSDEMDQQDNFAPSERVQQQPQQAPQQAQQSSRPATSSQAVSQALGGQQQPQTRVTEDPEKLLAEAEAAGADKAKLGELWKRAGMLSPADVVPVRAAIEALVAAHASAPAPEPTPEQAAQNVQQVMDAEFTEEVAA